MDTLRNSWLNPPEWTKTEVLEFPGSVNGPWHRYVHDANDRGIGTVRYPRTVAKDAAYGWPADLTDEEVLGRLLELNLERAGG